MNRFNAELIADLEGLRGIGLDPVRAPVYRRLLELGTFENGLERDALVENVLDRADATGETHLAVVARLAALTLLTGRQRELVEELLSLLAREVE